jgi:hypothetical protein
MQKDILPFKLASGAALLQREILSCCGSQFFFEKREIGPIQKGLCPKLFFCSLLLDHFVLNYSNVSRSFKTIVE